MTRPIHVIANEVWNDWGEKVNYAARPYLEAMDALDKITDNYYEDSGSSVVAYFLGNSNSWRGDTARRVKAELNAMLKEVYAR